MKKLLSILLSVIMFTACSHQETKLETNQNEQIQSQVTFINVGQGDSTFIQNNQHTMLIDAGHGEGYEDASLNYLKSQNIHTIDTMILTHCDADHINDAKDIVDQLDVKKIYMSSRTSTSYTYMKLLNAIKEKNKKIHVPKLNEQISIGKGKLKFIGIGEGAENNNDSSLCMNYDDGYHRFLFTGDASATMEEKLNDVQCDVFQAGHHGSRYSNGDSLLSRMKAKYVVISCGVNNMYGHPHQEALQRFSKYNMKVYRTDQLGTIQCKSSQSQLTFNGKKVESESTNNEKQEYIGSRRTKKYHYADCRYVQSIEEKNRVHFKTSEEAKEAGYRPCQACKP